MLIFPAYGQGQRTMLSRLSPSEASLELARSTFQFEGAGRRNLQVTACLARQLPAYRLTFGELGGVVGAIEHLAARQRPSGQD
jgi:hypothetical protein